MADCAFITKLSRRAMLAGGGAVLAAPSLAGPSPPHPGDDDAPDSDAELLRRLAFAQRRRAEYTAAQADCGHGLDAMTRHPDYPDMATLGQVTDAVRATWAELAEQTGYRAAVDRSERARARFEAAACAAFAIPACTPRGMCAKMRLAVAAARDGDYGNREGHRWLDIALADLERLAAGAPA